MKKLLFLAIALVMSVSAWAQVPTESGVYEIQNVSSEGSGVGRGYLIDYTEWTAGPSIGNCPWSNFTSNHPTNRNDGTSTCSYWYLYNADGTYYLFSLSTLNNNTAPKFLKIGVQGDDTVKRCKWQNTKNAIEIVTNTSRSGAVSIRNAGVTASNEYLSMGCGANSNEGCIKVDQFSDGGTQLRFIAVDESNLSPEQVAIKTAGIALCSSQITYSVRIDGAPSAAQLTIGGNSYNSGDTFQAESVNISSATATEIEDYDYAITIENETTIVVTYTKKPEYPYGFTNVAIPNDARKIMSATIGGVTVDFSSNNSMCYNDNTDKTFRIEYTDQPLTTQFNLNGGSWIHGYVYIDLNKDKQFTVSDPAELVTKSTNQSTSPDLAQTSAWNTFSCPEVGTYHIRLKTDWADTNPLGSSSFTTSQTSGQMIDAILEVVAPTNKVDVTYDLNVNGTKIGEKVITETIGNMPTIADWMNTLSSRDYVILNSMHNEAITAESGNAHVQVNTTYNSNLPFTPDGTTLYNLSLNREPALVIYAEGEGISTKATDNASYVAPTYANQNNYKWSFGGDWFNGFTLKNAGTQKYVSYGSNSPADNTPATFVESTEGDGCHFELRLKDGMKYFRIQGTTNEAYISNYNGATTTYLTNWSSSNNFNDSDAGAQFLIVADAINPPAIDWTLFETALSTVSSYPIGTGLGEYACTIYGYPVTAEQMSIYKDHWQDTLNDQEEGYYTTHMTEMNEALESMQINLPTPGSFLRIKGGVSNNYVAFTGNDNARVPQQADGTDAKTVIYYAEDGTIISYYNGKGMTGTHSQASVGATKETATFTASNYGIGKYCIKSNYDGSQVWYDHSTAVNRNSAENSANCSWYLEEVTTLPVTFMAAGEGYATIYSPVALEIPAGVVAYYGTVESEGTVKASSIEDGIIPANTAVVLFKEGVTETTTVDFTISDEAGTAESCFKGTVPAIATVENSYVFSIAGATPAPGFYSFEGATLAGFKAYYVSGGAADVQGFVLDFGGQTVGIEGLQTAAPVKGAFDLQGRRVNAATRGLFIQNGVKVIR